MKAGVNIRDQKVIMFRGYLEHFFLLHALKQNELIHASAVASWTSGPIWIVNDVPVDVWTKVAMLFAAKQQ